MSKHRSILAVVAAVLVGVFIVGCGGGGGEQTTNTSSESSMESDGSMEESSGSGSLALTANFEGDAPERETFDASGNSECGVDTIEGEKVVVNDNNTLRDVVVSVESGPSGLESEPKTVTVDQKNCMYKPHVVTAKTGQSIEVTHSDEGMHNVRGTQDGEQLFNVTTFKGQSKEISFDEPGVYSLECNVHPWMQGWVYVTDHGQAAVAGDDGKAMLNNLPAGDYTLNVWHEEYGTQTKEVSVSDGKEASVSLTFP